MGLFDPQTVLLYVGMVGLFEQLANLLTRLARLLRSNETNRSVHMVDY